MSNQSLTPGSALAGLTLSIVLSAPVVAQTGSGAIQASVTIETLSLTVTPVQDLLFGTHFTAAGTVLHEQAGEWLVEANARTSVDLTLTVLPASLSDAAGNSLPLTYGASSLQADCTGVIVKVGDPAVGITDCDLGPTPRSRVLLGLGPSTASAVAVDLTGAAAGTYTATIELTATVR